jgi:D-alanyl-D-alanine carboxypeptidase/D-alanyl-D-alanine-endopeptidase (penicillin-binding protein 4)
MIRAALLALCLAPLACIADTGLPLPVREALAKAGVPVAAVSAVVEPVEDGPVVVAHQARLAMNPASVMKVVTTFAALDLLGPAFTFRTDLLLAGELEGGVLKGDLVIRGGGDPKLGYERLWQLARRLRSRGLREIRGDIVVDRGYFAPVAHDPGRFDGDTRRAYNVGPDALLVNFQAVDFRFIPEGEGVRVSGEPDLPNVEIASRVKAVAGPCGAWRRNLKYEIDENGLLATAYFSGTYPAECGERTWPLSLFDGPRFTESMLRWVWSEAGGILRGKVRSGPAPAAAKPFLRYESEPLANLVRDTNKFSNNVMARQIFLALSAERNAGGGDTASSARIVSEWLRARGIDAPELVMENGSGLSREERVSAATMASVLRGAWSSAWMPELASSFPAFAVDGTLRTRRASPGGQAHLKGGTLTGVQAMAGYVLDGKGRRWIAVMFVNHPNANAAQPAFDAMVEWITRR